MLSQLVTTEISVPYLVGSTVTIERDTQLVVAQILAGQSHASTQGNLRKIRDVWGHIMSVIMYKMPNSTTLQVNYKLLSMQIFQWIHQPKG